MSLIKNPLMKLSNRRYAFFERYRDVPDKYGFNVETFAKWEPFFRFLFEDYFKTNVVGLENIPAEGRAVLVGNHSGVIPMDASMLYCAMYNLHSSPRRLRFLVLDLLLRLKHLDKLIAGCGGVPAHLSVAKELLENEELVCIYPEAERGTGKPFYMRYRLEDFNPGFVRAAIESGAPIIPVTTVGGDEIYPLLANCKPVAKLLNLPYWPLTPTFPWLPYMAAVIPLPIKFFIKIGKPIKLDYPPEAIEDKRLVRRLAREIQYEIQRELNAILAKRKNPFSGWDESSVLELAAEGRCLKL